MECIVVECSCVIVVVVVVVVAVAVECSIMKGSVVEGSAV